MYKRLTLEGLEWAKEASKDMKKRTKKSLKNLRFVNVKDIKKSGSSYY